MGFLYTSLSAITSSCFTLFYAITILLGVSRILANYRNYGGMVCIHWCIVSKYSFFYSLLHDTCSHIYTYIGYMLLWQHVSTKITSEQVPHSRSIGGISGSGSGARSPSVCMGGDWYTFPSHFFMPEGFKLQFVQDNFHGILPQHFSAPNGSWVNPHHSLAMNDKNTEEIDRYVSLERDCSYVVITLPPLSPPLSFSDHQHQEKQSISLDLSPLQSAVLQSMASNVEVSSPSHCVDDEKDLTERSFDAACTESSNPSFRIVHCEAIIDSSRSSSLARAYFIPQIIWNSQQINYKNYCLLKNTN